MFSSFWKNKIVSVVQWIVFILGSILLIISLAFPFYHTLLSGLVLVGFGIFILIFIELAKTTKEERNWFGIIRTLLPIAYVCAFPVTIILAVFSPLAVDAIPNNTLIHIFIVISCLLPVSIFVSLIKILYDKNKSVFWLLLPLIVFACWVGFDMYSSNYVQKEYQVQYAPLSTRGLPIPATDIPVILPPDPGQAGKATLAGIDSDNDGVRDDLEREIVYMYPQNQEVRRVLTAMVKKDQQLITTSGDANWFEGLWAESSALGSCSDYMIFGNEPSNLTNYYILHNMELNTSERKEKYNINLKSVSSPESLTGKQACDSNLVKNQY